MLIQVLKPGTNKARYPGDYAVRLIDVMVRKENAHYGSRKKKLWRQLTKIT